MERQSADLSTTAGSCRRHDSRRPAQRRRPVAVGAQCRGRISGQSPHRSQGLPTTGRRRTGRDQAGARHVRQCRRAGSLAQGRTPEVSYRPVAPNRRHDSAARNHTERIAQSGQDYESKMRSPNLSNTALISHLNGSASLRENSSIQGKQEFFTLRRKGAKEEAFQSKNTIPPLDLSGFAPLREPSATLAAAEFFTPRRKDAKKAYQSKRSVPSLDPSGSAALREIAATHSQQKSLTLRREDAKRSTSNDRISVPNLSGFAPLRETSPIPWRR